MSRARTWIAAVGIALVLSVSVNACDGPALNCSTLKTGEIRCTPNETSGGGGGGGGGW